MKTLFNLIVAVILFTSCQSIKIAKFDAYSFEKTSELKTKTAQLMEKASENYSDYNKEAEILLNELQTQIEYEKLKSNNLTTVAMWEKLTNKETSSIRKYFVLWKSKQKLSPEFIHQAITQTNEAFDKLITLEIKKER